MDQFIWNWIGPLLGRFWPGNGKPILVQTNAAVQNWTGPLPFAITGSLWQPLFVRYRAVTAMSTGTICASFSVGWDGAPSRTGPQREYAVKVMTSFGYEIMLTRGYWFQTLDVNKPWRQIPEAAYFFWCSHIFFSDYPKAIRRGKISLKSNHVIERNFEAANGRITKLVQASCKNRAYDVWVISQTCFA